MKGMSSIRCLHDFDIFPGLFFSPEVLGHQQFVGYQIPPFWHIYLQLLIYFYSFKIFGFPHTFLVRTSTATGQGKVQRYDRNEKRQN